MSRIKSVILMSAAVMAVQLLTAATASAHLINVTAEARCVDEAPVIFFSVSTVRVPPLGIPPPAFDEHANIVVSWTGFSTTVSTVGDGLADGSGPAPATASTIVSATAVGNWTDGFPGGQNAQVTVTIPQDCATVPGIGRFTGGPNIIQILTNGALVEAGASALRKNGELKITGGLTIHCDLLLSNNLEINWAGNHFHLLEHLTTIECSDSPEIDQKPPVAPIDTLVGTGEGRLNGEDGFSIVFTLIDAGEPGREDFFGFVIRDSSGNVVFSAPVSQLIGGNLQAHFDQPHGNKPQ